MRPGIVHRLDRGTSGVMVVAKNDAAHQELSRQFHDREVEKEYIVRILEKTGGNKYQAAHVLGIDRKTLYRKLAEIEGKAHSDE